MILIADSGGTKTAWKLLSDTTADIVTSGMNPYYHSVSALTSIIEKELLTQLPDPISSIYFYGAGCSSSESRNKIISSMQPSFPGTDIHVHHDLLGAARALCKNKQGIVGILGTGSNSGYYDGINIVKNVPSLGYVLGDEGGGVHMGKLLLSDYLRSKLPATIHKEMSIFELTKTIIEKKIYIDPNPIAFLSSFSPFILENIQTEYMNRLVNNTFEKFVNDCLRGYKELNSVPLHFSGSIAYHFKSNLKNVLDKSNLLVGSIVKNPMIGLTEFHQQI